MRSVFLENQINKHIDVSSSIIIFGGGQMENKIFEKNQFKNVSFLNIDDVDLSNVKYKKIIASMNENNLPSKSYDYAIANASIHHSSKPHFSILEMYRISKKGILILEGNDSLLMRISNKIPLSEIYERSAIHENHGGVDNSNTPNFIYRWTEREIYKLISSYKPDVDHKITYEYSYDLGNILKKNFFKKKVVNFFLKIFFKIFKKQMNLLSIFIDIKNSKPRVF